MATSYTTTTGEVLLIPNAYSTYSVVNGAGGLATTGLLCLLGECPNGPDFSKEDDLNNSFFGPNSLADAIAKYGDGDLTLAMRSAITPANDPDIQGSPAGFILVKTNAGTKASGSLTDTQTGPYATLFSANYGQSGNMFYYTVTQATPETNPTTGLFTYIPPVASFNADFRSSGYAALSLSVSAAEDPATFRNAFNTLAGITAGLQATGGILQTVLPGISGNLALAHTSLVVTISYTGTFTTTPSVGDTLTITTASVLAGAGNANVGAYVVTNATNNTIVATKLSDAGKPAAVAGIVTTPATVASTPVASTSDIEDYSAIAISTLANIGIVDGLGKTLELNELTSGSDLLSRTAYVLGTTTPVSWISKSGSPKMLTSASEYSVNLNVNRQSDNISQTLTAGGPVVLRLGYTGVDCTVVVGPTTMTITVSGGAGSNQSINLKNFSTISELTTFLNSLTGFTASPGSTALGQQSPLALDEGTYHSSTTFGNQTMRLKMDAVSFFQAVSASGTVQLNNPAATAPSGIPAVQSITYMTGGTTGATTDAIYDAALDAIKAVKCNFVIPLFSRDASANIVDGLTDAGSSYTIANINAATRSHVLAMSTLKRGKNRQAFLSNRGTYAAAKAEAGDIASALCTMSFQDMKVVGSNGIVQAQPWITAVVAAGMQAAGFYKAFFHKGINCSGVVQAAGDFKDNNDDQVEDALQSGLLFVRKSDTGTFQYVSDQTTYLKDNNFVYNSVQAQYASNILSLTTKQRMDQMFVSQSLADINAAVAMSGFEMIMDDLLSKKIIAKSDDAPLGYKNAKIKIAGPVMLVEAEAKIATALYFVVIRFSLSQVTSAASQ